MTYSFKLTAGAPSSRMPTQAVNAVWVVLLAIAVTSTFWATNHMCGLLVQRTLQMQRQLYRPQVDYSKLWKQGRH